MKHALVTGANGFIGSHLVERLLSQGVKVRCFLKTGLSPGWLEGLPVEILYGDILDAKSLDEAVKGVDTVYHLAGVTRSPRKSDYFEINTKGTITLLNSVLKEKSAIERFVFISSQTVGGPSPQGKAICEEDPPAPITPYGKSKLEAEKAVLSASSSIPVAVVRAPSVCGPRDTDVLHFFKWINKGIHPVLGGGKRTASMIYVDDLVRGLIIMGTHKNAVGQVYYIVSEPVVDIDDLGRMIAQIMGKKALTVHVPVWPAYAFTVLADPFAKIFNFQTVINKYRMVEYRECCWICDGSKAERELGFKPEVKLKEALEKCYVWYREAGWI